MAQKLSLTKVDYAARRKTFLHGIKDGFAIFPSAPDVIRNNDVHHSYRQDSNFYYLTGHEEAHCVALLNPQAKASYTLFLQPKDKLKELWEGKLLGLEGAKKVLGAEQSFSIWDNAALDEQIIQGLLSADKLYFRLGVDAEWDQRIFRLMAKAAKRLGRTGREYWPIYDPNSVLGEMRLFKSRAEIDRLQVASNITAEAHVHAMKFTKPGMNEREVEAALFHNFRASGAGRLGYGSIVASGMNACVLHYVNNNRLMPNGDLLLIDAGAEFDYYTSDITRCFPVGERFTPAQKEVYEAVLTAQKSCIKMARPGTTMKAIHQNAVEVLTEELKKLKVLKGATAQLIKSEAYRPYYPHGTGHWLGMDVHDVGRYFDGEYESSRKLKPGMVFTIEPGLYFGEDSGGPAKYKGIGVRIEDDIVITASGCHVLTSLVPKEVDEIESLRGGA